MLRLAARYADASNLFGSSPDDVAHKLEVLRSHCEAEGRDYASIQKTVLAVRPALADVDAFIAAADEYAALGVTKMQVMPDRHPVEFTEQIAERVLPRLADID
jgi:alkanesulfonate monooxygenase SsuD/methylene tetrahydromethanopterin reductase-like flavin-dependent oxidoreductase (luciferase family)